MNDKIMNCFASLVGFLRKEYKYRVVEKDTINFGKAHLVNKAYKYQMVVIDVADTIENNGLNQRQINVLNYVDNKEAILVIKITDQQTQPLTLIDGVWTIHTTPESFKNDLMYLFGDINKIHNYMKIDPSIQAKMTPNELAESNNKNFNSFLGKLKNNNVRLTWYVLFLFIIIPSVATILGSVYLANYWWIASEAGTIKNPVDLAMGGASLVFGGTNRTIAIEGGQWWRIFTYGFSAIDTGSTNLIFQVLFLFIIGSTLFSTTRMTEIITGSNLKIILPLVCGYLTLGFIASTTLPYTITSGSLPILGIMVGILLMNVSGDTSPVSIFAKAKSVVPIAILIFLAIFSSDQTGAFAISFLGVVLGSIYGWLFKSKINQWTNTQKIMCALLLFLIVIGIVFIFKINNIPAENGNVIAALEFYISKGIMSQATAEKITGVNIGWNGHFQEINVSGNTSTVWAWVSEFK